MQAEFYFTDATGNPLVYIGRDDYTESDWPTVKDISLLIPEGFTGPFVVAAIATDATGTGNTSEFSPPVISPLIHEDSFESE